MSDGAHRALEVAFRRLSPQLVAALGRRVGPGRLDLAEDAVQFAMLQAARTWGFHGAPEQPRAWLLHVASNRLNDLLRQRTREAPSEDASTEASGLEEPAPEPPPFATELPDDELRLLFACCHPALSVELQVTLTLKVACGFSVREIALALLADETAVAQRIVRAKRTLREHRVSLEVPGPEELPPRFAAVHPVLYLLFNEGYEASGGEALSRVELCEEALRLVELLLSSPRTATHEGHALAALFCFRAAQLSVRAGASGAFVPQAARGPATAHPAFARGERHLRASMGERLTALHLEAEIAFLHARAPAPDAVDWPRILALYDALLVLKPSPTVALSRVVALGRARGAREALTALRPLCSEPLLSRYPWLFAVEGELREQLGEHARAEDCFRQAAALARTPPQCEYLLARARGRPSG
ncbi:sigma-70 family RNA polymerase sigma factor [Myxococcaceae bacterium GXIMD 01537]